MVEAVLPYSLYLAVYLPRCFSTSPDCPGPFSKSAFIRAWVAGRCTEVVKASHPGCISASGGMLATSTSFFVSAIACLLNDAMRVAGASTTLHRGAPDSHNRNAPPIHH